MTGAEYEAIHSCWCKAIKVLPDYSVVHKQDWFIKERYKPELQKDDMSFLSRSFERHFNERPYLKHTCYLYLTKTTKERNRMQSNFSTLCRGHIIPKELDRETTTKFLEACEQFERGKKPLKEKKEDPKDPPSCGGSSDGKEEKTVKESTTDPESGWFRIYEEKLMEELTDRKEKK